MVESALATLDPRRREHLRALGFELLQLRTSRAADVASNPRLVLRGASKGPLFDAVIQALGLQQADIGTSALAGVPTLAFGAGEANAIAAPEWNALRSAAAKRALWPTLRRLRREFGTRG